MVTHANALVVMAKAPAPGQVKTRLIPPLTAEEAADLYRCLLLDLLEGLSSFGEADLYLAFTPEDTASLFHEMIPPRFVCFPQRGNDLGKRMKYIFEDLFGLSYKSIVIIGSDLILFPPRYLQDAFAALGDSRHSVVLGPSRDGGYYLIGLTPPGAEIFEHIPWGSEQVLSATCEKLSHLGLHAHFLPRWFDVDTVEDLRYLKSSAVPAATGFQRRTLEILKKLSISV